MYALSPSTKRSHERSTALLQKAEELLVAVAGDPVLVGLPRPVSLVSTQGGDGQLVVEPLQPMEPVGGDGSEGGSSEGGDKGGGDSLRMGGGSIGAGLSGGGRGGSRGGRTPWLLFFFIAPLHARGVGGA